MECALLKLIVKLLLRTEKQKHYTFVSLNSHSATIGTITRDSLKDYLSLTHPCLYS
jgi:hypothetical protein